MKKRNLLLGTLVVALACAVFVNWYYTRPPADETAGSKTTLSDGKQVNLGDAQYVGASVDEEAVAAGASAEYFAAAKLRRQQAHDQAKETLTKIIANTKASDKALEGANKTLTDLTAAIKKEADMENLITAKLACACVVILNTDGVEVILPGGKLNDQAVLQVKDICIKQTKLPSTGITVVEQK
ncbi:MAG: SpoIIIAH-like family protein [Oscillospiraceae bacterium]|jgi:hypothetical protein|nr:SpoIIIAH-like family protein [Oscillospiraceae bacterium]